MGTDHNETSLLLYPSTVLPLGLNYELLVDLLLVTEKEIVSKVSAPFISGSPKTPLAYLKCMSVLGNSSRARV